MTQHIIPTHTGLISYQNKPAMLICGFDRPLNNMFFNIIVDPENEDDEEICISTECNDFDELVDFVEACPYKADIQLDSDILHYLSILIWNELVKYNYLHEPFNTNQQTVYTTDLLNTAKAYLATVEQELSDD